MLILIKKMEHTAIIVKNMEESINYYMEMFGFKMRTRGSNERRDMAFLYHENLPQFEVELIEDLKKDSVYAEVGVVNHLAFTVEDIYVAIDYFKKKGIIFKSHSPNIAVDGAKTIFFTGINGELLQLVQPTRTY
ncbi:VOC family protein [Bacillaceae bacterium IKA-2]|nr:VOC family protein [Bacillaceae bacterium IKA-2]